LLIIYDFIGHFLTVLQYMQAIWENQFYYMFGFLFLVFIILIISCSQISIVMVYFQLCGEVNFNSLSQLLCGYLVTALPM